MINRQLSRREVLSGSAAALATASLSNLAMAKDIDPFSGFTVAIQSYTFRKFSLEQALKRIASVGIKHGEFYPAHIPITDNADKTKAALKACSEAGVAPVSFGVEEFNKDHDANKKKFEFAKALGIKYMSANPTPDAFDSLDKLCEEYKIAIAIHPHGPTGRGKERHRWWSAEVILAAVKDHHELIGTCLDTGHLIRMAQLGEMLDPAQQVKVMGKRNFGMHLKDHDNKRKTDVLYGQDGGVLDVVAVLKALREVKFTGYIAIEYEAKENEPTEDVKALVKILQESAKKLA